jgi:hypothetical protein
MLYQKVYDLGKLSLMDIEKVKEVFHFHNPNGAYTKVLYYQDILRSFLSAKEFASKIDQNVPEKIAKCCLTNNLR